MNIQPFGFSPATPALLRKKMPRLQIVGTRGQSLGQDTNGALGGANGTNYTRAESRFYSKLGPQAVADFQLMYANSYLTAGSGDALTPNDITVQSAIELQDANPYCYQAQFDGAPSRVLGAGAAGVLTDKVAIDVAAGGFVWLRTDVTVPSGLRWPRGGFKSFTGEKAVESNEATSQLLTTGALATPGTGVESNAYLPQAVLGVPDRPFLSAVILGDSIAEGSGDDSIGDGFGNRGFVARGLNSVSGVVVPWCKITMPSDNPIAQRNHQSWRRHTPWNYADLLINEHGGNQLSSVTAAVMLTHLQRIWLQGRRRGMRVIQVKLGPRTTCSTAAKWTTPASQDGYASGFEPGGKRDQLNAMIDAALVAGEIDGVIDPNVDWEDQANPGKWVTNGTANFPTSDGVHPSATFHALVGNRVSAAVSTFVY